MSQQIVRLAALAIATASLANAAAGAAADRETADPAAYLQAFNDTCRRGFPDLDAIAQNALRQGWQESSMRPTSGVADIFSEALPRALHKDGLMLFLTHPTGGEIKEVCQISGSATTKLTGADIVAVVAPSITSSQPVIDKGPDHDGAIWTVAPTMSVKAGIAIYHKTRTISISVRHTR